MTESRDLLSNRQIDEIIERLNQGLRIRRSLPGGRLHIDRPLPFLCVYRLPAEQEDEGTNQLVEGEASFLYFSATKAFSGTATRLMKKLVGALHERFGAVLLIEIWSAPDEEVESAAGEDEIEPTELAPDFAIIAKETGLPVVNRLKKQLDRISYQKQIATTSVLRNQLNHPDGMRNLISTADATAYSVTTIGICVRPIFRNHETGQVFPDVLRSIKRGLGKALKQACYTFVKTQTNVSPAHYYSLGRRAMVKAVRDVDRRISEVADCFDFLLQSTPVNAEAAWKEFRRKKFESIPRFYYRPLSVEPSILKRRLYGVRIEDIEDPTLGELFRQRQDELDRKITMLSDIDGPNYLLGSLQIYGKVEPRLVRLASRILKTYSSRHRETAATVSAEEFARLARKEIDYYRAVMPEFVAQVIVRDDIYAGLICSKGNLLIGQNTRVGKRRVEALLQHEVGTHLLTYYNGLRQPLQQLHSGFAGYDALQEGLAVFCEYLVGGLDPPRLRLLAARVMAVHYLVGGAGFRDVFRRIHLEFGFTARTAYTITMRVFRGGGLTKDAVYLMGLVQMLDYMKTDGDLDPLLIGKIAVEHISLIKELQLRKILSAPTVQPRYLQMPGVAQRLTRAKQGLRVMELLKR